MHIIIKDIFIFGKWINQSIFKNILMFNIIILVIGKIKESYYLEAIQEYQKRLKPYAKIEIVELKPEPFGASNKEKSKKAEGERIINFLNKNRDSEIFLLDERGENMPSENFAGIINKINGRIIFVIGGALGFDKNIFSKYRNRISLSRMTFPHEMARVILLEQIYRAITIIKNKQYHY